MRDGFDEEQLGIFHFYHERLKIGHQESIERGGLPRHVVAGFNGNKLQKRYYTIMLVYHGSGFSRYG